MKKSNLFLSDSALLHDVSMAAAQAAKNGDSAIGDFVRAWSNCFLTDSGAPRAMSVLDSTVAILETERRNMMTLKWKDDSGNSRHGFNDAGARLKTVLAKSGIALSYPRKGVASYKLAEKTTLEATPEAILSVTHAHPTQTEAIKEAVADALGEAINF